MRMLSKRSRTESPLPNIISPAIVRPSLRVFWSVVISPMLRRGTIFQGPQLEMFKSVQEGQTDLVFQGEGGSQEYFDPEKDFEYKRLDFANL